MQLIVCALLVAGVAGNACADIDLAFQTSDSPAEVGQIINVEFYAISDNDEENQCFAAIDLILLWDPAYLELIGIDDTGGAGLLASSFPNNDVYGINEQPVPQDGDAYYQALAPLGNAIDATPAGTLVTTFQFQAIAPTEGTLVDIGVSAGDPVLFTKVFDGTVPNLDVTGTLTGTDVVIGSGDDCPADIDEDGEVGTADLLILLGEWGMCKGCASDITADGMVNTEDLLELLGAWGPCP